MKKTRCLICRKLIESKDEVVRIQREKIGDYVKVHYFCAQRSRGKFSKVIEMAQNTRFFTNKTGAASAILRFKKDEDEAKAIQRLTEKNGWDVANHAYHVIDDNMGKAIHFGVKDDCKYCRKSEIPAKDAATEEAPAEYALVGRKTEGAQPKKRGRPKKKVD